MTIRKLLGEFLKNEKNFHTENNLVLEHLCQNAEDNPEILFFPA